MVSKISKSHYKKMVKIEALEENFDAEEVTVSKDVDEIDEDDILDSDEDY